MIKSNIKIYAVYFSIGLFAVGFSFLTSQYFLRTLKAQAPQQVNPGMQMPKLTPEQLNSLSPEVKQQLFQAQQQVNANNKKAITPEMEKQILDMQKQMQQQNSGALPQQAQPEMPGQQMNQVTPKVNRQEAITNNTNYNPSKKLEMVNPNMNMINQTTKRKFSKDEGRLVRSTEFDLILEPYNYDSNGRRDPFQRVEVSTSGGPSFPLLPLEKFDLAQIKLTGIIWDVNNPKAMFMDPNDKVHILSKNQRIGRNKGYIAVIREGEVVIVEAGLDGAEEAYTTKVLRIIGDQ